MSERVVPTKPDVWWFCCHEYSASDNQIVHVIDEGGSLVFYGGLFNEFLPVASPCVTWLSPVPSAEAVQAAIDAMAQAKSAMKAWMRECEWRVFVANLDNAISGLTGGEG